MRYELTFENRTPHPRIDRVVERLQPLDDGMYRETGEVSCLCGEPTPGATLENLRGVPDEPPNHQTKGFVLVPSGASFIGPSATVALGAS